MYVAQTVNYVIYDVDEEQRNNGIKFNVLVEDMQVALNELDGLIGPVVRHEYR